MSVRSGKSANVKLGTYTVSEMGEWTFSGFTRDVIEYFSFGNDFKRYVFGVADGGEITFRGYYDPADTTGQDLINSACVNSSSFTGGDLKFYVDNTSYFTVNTGGNIMITKCLSVTMEKAAVGTIEFTGKVTGAKMVLI